MEDDESDIHASEINLLALRHAVYRELQMLLPPASIDQTMQFIANLALCRDAYRTAETVDERDRAIEKIIARFRDLRISPDTATATNYKKPSHAEIELAL